MRCPRGSTMSSGKLGASLATTIGQDGTPGARAHTETESVLLGTATVIRLVSALTHMRSFGTGVTGFRPPLTHDRKRSWACGGRHLKMTPQRYAGGPSGVKPTQPPTFTVVHTAHMSDTPMSTPHSEHALVGNHSRLLASQRYP